MFFNSRSYTTSCRERTRTLYLSLPGRRCLQKNQLYPAISIGLHAKTSTLYCYHRHIIRDIGTSHFPVSGRGIGSHVRANRGREADQTTNPCVCSYDIETAFIHIAYPPVDMPRDSHKNRQLIMHGELVAYLASLLFQQCISSLREIRSAFFNQPISLVNIALTFAEQRAYIWL